MKKRLRKKLHKGEFQELGFSFEIKFKSQEEERIETFLNEFVELLREHYLEMGGGWNAENCGGFIVSSKGSVTPELQEIVRKWLETKGEIIDHLSIGELKDAWYGWK